MNGRRLWAVMDKEMRELLRDPITVWICLLLPLVMLFLFGYAITLDVDDVALGVLDRDKIPASRVLTDRFVQSGYFQLQEYFQTEQEVGAALQRGRIRLALIIPPRLQEALVRRETPAVQVLVDGTYSVTAVIVANYAQAIIGNFPPMTRPQIQASPLQAEIRVWYNAPLLYTLVFPARYFVELSRGIVLKGSEPEILWFNVLLLAFYTLVVFGLAVSRFRKKVA